MATKYSLEDRYRAAAALIATGNSKAASQQSGVPASTIRHWDNSDPDFQMMCQEIRTEYGEKIKFKLAEIIDESATQILDRVRNGDVIRDPKTGELVRVPIKGRDLAIIGGVSFDKLRLAENQPTTIVKQDSKENLRQLAEEFKKIGDASKEGDRAEYERLTRQFGDCALPWQEEEE